MKLEVGMYVRTDLGEIGKVTSVSDNLSDLGIRAIAYNSEPYLKGREIKVSHNIIDLIEVGDYVNGYKVINLYNPTGNEILWIILSCNPLDHWKNEDIKSIVTKEQMEAMQYKVVEE